MRCYATVLTAAVLAVGGLARADFVAEVWGNAPSCHHRGTLTIGENGVAAFDLSALPAKTRIQRAVLRADFRRSGYGTTIRIHALSPTQQQAGEDEPILALRAPLYNSFDATAAVRGWAAGDRKAPLRLHFRTAPGWQRATTTLEIACEGKAGEATPAVKDLKAIHHDGQTFLTWTEHEDIVAEDPVTIEKLEQKLLPLRGKADVVYRVYAHDRPITAATLPEAALLVEVPFVLSAYYLDSVATIEHPNPARGEGSTPLIPGARARRQTVPRYVIADGQPPLPRGTGLYVRTITSAGRTWYAVLAAVNGREAVAAGGLSAANSLAQPVDEKIAPPIPVMQARAEAKDGNGRPRWTVKTYNYWLEYPYVNVPRQLQFGTREALDLGAGGGHLLWVQLGAYGSQAIFNAFQRGGGDVAICPPWDIDDSILQGRHECLETLKSYEQGVVHNWAQRRTLALVDWAKRVYPVSGERVVVEGQFPLWAMRYPEVFAGVIGDAYGNFNKGREAQKHGFTWGPYPRGCRNFAGVDQWDYMNICKYIRDNPKVELPYYVSRPTGSSHVGDIGPWAWPELFRALHDTKRAFSARWGGPWAGAPVAGSVMVGKIRLHQSLPAFGRCSLDGCPGDGELNPGGVGGDGDPVGDINGWLVWETDDIVDEPGRWEMTVSLYGGEGREKRNACPAETCTTDLTPRRCQKFRAAAGAKFTWTNSVIDQPTPAGEAPPARPAPRQVQSGSAVADPHGLVTLEGLTVTKARHRIQIQAR